MREMGIYLIEIKYCIAKIKMVRAMADLNCQEFLNLHSNVRKLVKDTLNPNFETS